MFQNLIKLSAISFFFFVCSSCYKESHLDFIPDFEIEVVNDNYSAPSEITILNKTIGADQYRWTFEGGTPASSNLKTPGNIVFRQPGKHVIRLECISGSRSAVKELELMLDSIIIPKFSTEIQINAFAPADVRIVSQSSGSSYYEWTFEGGTPGSCKETTPPVIKYEQPGTYIICLTTGNSRKQYKYTDTITILPRLQSAFKLIPAFENEDYQAPAVFTANNLSISNLKSHWEVSGGTVRNDTATHPEFHFEQPGTYTVTLHTDNNKEQQTISQTINVYQNTNLYSMKDIKMGISSSQNNGSFYSCQLRKVFTEKEISETNGKWIDFIFFALNDRFNYCKFISPDKANEFVYSPIPQAIRTYLINDIKTSGLSFGMSEFESMADDRILQALNIKQKDTGDFYFKLDALPYLVLFETEDGRKGAICIKSIEKSGMESYITADIKVQKKKKP